MLLAAGIGLVGIVGTVTVVINAPTFFAELLLDAVVAGAAYRRLREVPRSGWVLGAIGRTWLPMFAILVTTMAVGLLSNGFDQTW